jgi:3-oxoacyl-[acyl-carrier protein] reductase
MSRLTGKVVVVTGASKGIGAGIAKALAAEGAAVVVNYASSKEGADRLFQRWAPVERSGKIQRRPDRRRLLEKLLVTVGVAPPSAG